MMRDSLRGFAQQGAEKYPQEFTLEDVLRGYMDTREADWALQTLIDWHMHGKAATGLKVGDRVRVRRTAVHLGDIDVASGWSGFAPLFSDHVATVREVFWNGVWHHWGVRIEYDTRLRWLDWSKDLYVRDEPVSFYFGVDQVKKVKKGKKR